LVHFTLVVLKLISPFLVVCWLCITFSVETRDYFLRQVTLYLSISTSFQFSVSVSLPLFSPLVWPQKLGESRQDHLRAHGLPDLHRSMTSCVGTHTHTHTLSLSLSISHTHTKTLEPRILSRNFVRTNTRLEKDDFEKK